MTLAGDIKIEVWLPLRWRKPRRIFVCSMTDLFGEWVPDEWIDRVFAVMALCPQHVFQVLTKRPERMRAYMTAQYVFNLIGAAAQDIAGRLFTGNDIPAWPLPNVHLGVSVENQATADARVPPLLQTPAAVRMVSYEPALGPVDFRPWLMPRCQGCGGYRRRGDEDHGFVERTGDPEYPEQGYPCGPVDTALDWIVVGGESGPTFRSMDLAWLRSVYDQTRAAGTPLFVKQDSGSRPGQQGRVPDDLWAVKGFATIDAMLRRS